MSHARMRRRLVVPTALVLVLLMMTGAGGAKKPPAAKPQVSTETLPMLLQRGAQAFAAGDFPQAAEAFGRVEADFGGEPDWRSGALPRRLLPLRGFASLRAGRADAAADDLAAFLEQYPGDAGQRGFARFALALACEQAGRWTDALGHFETFETEHPGTAQATLARLRRAEILFADARPDEALSLLTAMADDPGVAESFRTQARLRACEWAVELGRDALAADLLLGAPWNVATMPEIGVLAFAALETGDRMLAAGRADDAVRAYRLVPPKRQLVAAQRERLGDFERLIAERAPAAIGSGLFWTDYYRARLDRVRAQLATLEAAEDYSWPLRLRQGQAMLLAGRGREAWLCFETVATTSEATEEVRRDGHYRWILAAAELARWDDALVIARDYVERFPESTLAAEAFHLIARAHLERQDFTSAEAVLGDIVTRFPDSSTAVRARFTRGWVRTMREDYPAARDDFAGCVAAEPSGPLAAQAGLWIGLTHHFAREFEQALAAFDALVAAHPRDPQLPEILYRRGATLYAMRDFVRAREAMSGFVSTYRMHARHPEALVLLGDILMGSGDLAEARRHFAEVPVEATDSFVYAAFQIGKILRAQARYADMAEHFSSYVRRAGSSPLPRVSEALYHLGWAEEQRGHAAAALPVYAEALARFGDDPAAAEVGTTLNALQRLSRRLQRTETTDAAIDPAMHRLVGGDFAGWLHEERERARAAARATWHARLTLALADVHLSRREPTQAEVLLLELVGSAPLEALDAAGLARVGMTLQSIGSEEAEAYFHRLLAAYPRCPERAVAYVGLATSSARGRRPADALAWIARFDRETPGHPLAPQAGLLAGEVLEQTGRHDEAAKRYDSVLRLKAARGRAHAQALTGLARCARAGGDPSRAIAYFQRVYTLHRAQGDLAAIAYLESAPLFEALGDAAAAAATYREMLGLAGVGDEVQRAHARRALATLEQRLSTTSTPDAS